MKGPIVAVCALLALSGCASTPAGKAVEDVSTVVAAGMIGDRISDGDKTVAVAAAGGALAIKKVVEYSAAKKADRRVKDAFDLGQLQATKSLYQAIQNTQAEDTSAASLEDESTLLPLTAPERVINGVTVNPTTEYVRLHK